MLVSALVLGLLMAIALGSIRTMLVAILMLLCVLFPDLLTIGIPEMARAFCSIYTSWAR